MKHENIEIFAELNCSVIRGTLRAQDLIPAFLDVIKDIPENLSPTPAVPSYALEDDSSEWWNEDACLHLLHETLMDLLNLYAPEGYYFGSHSGNSSDFGYWPLGEQEY